MKWNLISKTGKVFKICTKFSHRLDLIDPCFKDDNNVRARIIHPFEYEP
jgi:hypothetical protein